MRFGLGGTDFVCSLLSVGWGRGIVPRFSRGPLFCFLDCFREWLKLNWSRTWVGLSKASSEQVTRWGGRGSGRSGGGCPAGSRHLGCGRAWELALAFSSLTSTVRVIGVLALLVTGEKSHPHCHPRLENDCNSDSLEMMLLSPLSFEYA